MLPVMLRSAAFAAALCAFAISTQAQQMEGLDHQHHHHAEATEKLGSVHFPTACNAAAQAGMQRGVALLHSFGYAEAHMQFEQVTKDDPKCAIAYWGLAMAGYTELWEEPTPEQIHTGQSELKKAKSLEATATPLERGYIAALDAFYAPKGAQYQQRADAYVAKMMQLHQAFPDDVEVSAFAALSLIASVPRTDTSLDRERQALAILLPLFAAHPDHPGLAHYIIHTCDTPALAAQGVAAARVYARIAPSSPHALHMPGHIFARLGMWQEDINSNMASAAASDKAAAEGTPGFAHKMHANEFLIYAYLQTGQDAKAEQLTRGMAALGKQAAAMHGMDDMKDAGDYFTDEMNVIYPAEMHDWKALAALPPSIGDGSGNLFIAWGRSMAGGHRNDAKLAAAALSEMEADHKQSLAEGNTGYSRGYEIKHDEAQAWAAYTQDKGAEAETDMRKAADLQDKLGQAEVDIPAREMLGDLLMMENKPQQALVEYQASMKLSPNRLNGYLSAALAASAAGKPQLAKEYDSAAAAQTNNAATSTRPELVHAVQVARGAAPATVAAR